MCHDGSAPLPWMRQSGAVECILVPVDGVEVEAAMHQIEGIPLDIVTMTVSAKEDDGVFHCL